MPYFFNNSANASPGPPSYSQQVPEDQKPASNTMQVVVNFALNQRVEVRLNVDSPWTVGVVLAVLNAAQNKFGIEYEIQYQAGDRSFTGRFGAGSGNIRPRRQ